MKRLLVMAIVLILSSQNTAFAKVGSGGQASPSGGNTAEPVPQAPTETVVEKTEEPIKTETPKVTPNPTTEEKRKATGTQIIPDQVTNTLLHCGQKKDQKERVACRLDVYNAKLSESVRKDRLSMIQLENKDAYFPEGCRRGNESWQENCKKRYKAIGPCWYDDNYNRNDSEYKSKNSYEGGRVIGCLKSKLQLPDRLLPIETYCKDKDASCPEEYKKAVHDLIVARFYDVEERAEILLEQGRATQENAVEFITFIGEQKIAFYDATTKEERKTVIQKVIDQWKIFTNSLTQ
jgi:hypothetical protein